jgi:predicted Fe-Mo cluster-binding NifX family protein
MKLCIPVERDEGLESEVCAHFGSAPLFVVLDTDSGACRSIVNRNEHHAHGMCRPLDALAGEDLDGLVVGGIGRGALVKLRQAGIPVYLAQQPTVAATLEAYRAGALEPMNDADACGGRHGGMHR